MPPNAWSLKCRCFQSRDYARTRASALDEPAAIVARGPSADGLFPNQSDGGATKRARSTTAEPCTALFSPMSCSRVFCPKRAPADPLPRTPAFWPAMPANRTALRRDRGYPRANLFGSNFRPAAVLVNSAIRGAKRDIGGLPNARRGRSGLPTRRRPAAASSTTACDHAIPISPVVGPNHAQIAKRLRAYQ